MVRGTTAQYRFKLPFAKKDITWATVKFWQPHNLREDLPITKRLADCSLPSDSQELCISLTAEETARFVDKYKAKVQLRGLHTESGTVFGCKPQFINVYPMEDELIKDKQDALPPDIIILDGNAEGTLIELDAMS